MGLDLRSPKDAGDNLEMKYLLLIGMTLWLSASFAAEQPLACEDKLAVLERQGVNRGAFLQALKNVRSGDTPSRYVLMAHLGRQQEGEMHLVDTHTGQVRNYKMWHGFPENHGESLNKKAHEMTYFGGQQLQFDEADYRQYHRVKTETISPSLKNKLAARGDQPGGNQVLLKCSKKFRDNPKRSVPSLNDPCMEPKDLDEVMTLLKAEQTSSTAKPKPSVVMFTYPTRNLDNYLRQVKLSNDTPDVCKTLAKMPVNGTPASSSGASGAAPQSGGTLDDGTE